MKISSVIALSTSLIFTHTSYGDWDVLWGENPPEANLVKNMYPENATRLELNASSDEVTFKLFDVSSQDGIVGVKSGCFDGKNSGLCEFTEGLCGRMVSSGDFLFKQMSSAKPVDIIMPRLSARISVMKTKDTRITAQSLLLLNPDISIDGDFSIFTRGDVLAHHFPEERPSSLLKVRGNFTVDTQDSNFSIIGCEIDVDKNYALEARDFIFDSIAMRNGFKNSKISVGKKFAAKLSGDWKSRLGNINVDALEVNSREFRSRATNVVMEHKGVINTQIYDEISRVFNEDQFIKHNFPVTDSIFPLNSNTRN